MSAPVLVRPDRTAGPGRGDPSGSTDSIRSNRRRRWVLLPTILASVIAALVALVAMAPSTPDGPLWDQPPGTPAGFAEVVGYTPATVTLADGATRPAKPSGDCSWLPAGEPFGFSPLCQVHDHGYELLRAAAVVGEPVDPQVRKQVDAMFASDLRTHCAATQDGLAEVACHLVSRVTTGAVELNSWRQGYGVPGEEPVAVWLLGAALFGAALAGLVVAGRRMRAPMLALAERTPADRDRYVDLLRTGSLLVVVVGHWLMMVVTRTPDGLAVDNLLGVEPRLQPVTWVLQVMPVFFLVGGFANLVTWRGVQARGGGLVDYLVGRGRRLVTPVIALAVTWGVAGPALLAAGVRPDHVETTVRLVAQPLWFLAVFLAASAMVPSMARLHDRHGARVVVVLGVGVVAVDVLRFGLGLTAAGWLNLGLVWLCVQQVGFFYADGRLQVLPRRRLVALTSAGLVALLALTTFGPYPVSMVGVPGASVSNMTPPTVAILALGVVQLGLVLLLRGPGSAWLARPRVWAGVVATGSMAMTLFLWHLTAAVAVVGFAVAAEVPLAAGGTSRWWLERPIWLAVLAVVLLSVAPLAAKLERPRSRGLLAAGSPRRVALAVGAVVIAIAGFGWLATYGFGGAGIVGVALLVVAAVVLRAAPARSLVAAEVEVPDGVSGRRPAVRDEPAVDPQGRQHERRAGRRMHRGQDPSGGPVVRRVQRAQHRPHGEDRSHDRQDADPAGGAPGGRGQQRHAGSEVHDRGHRDLDRADLELLGTERG